MICRSTLGFLHNPKISLLKPLEACRIRSVPFENWKDRAAGSARAEPHPLHQLAREDLDLVTELTLQSGSLKALAESYGVSYPTIRGRLDRVIERLRAAVEGRPRDPLGELLADLVERGELSVASARAIRATASRARDGSARPGTSLDPLGGPRDES